MRTAALLEKLADGVAELVTTESWQAFLDVQAKFHDYSPNNCMLIAMQMPTATRVAGYKTWQKLGRQVRKGEKAIHILAPRTYTKAKADGAEEIKLYFRGVCVFDVSQTDGDELPSITTELEGDAAIAELGAMLELAEAEGLDVVIQDTGAAGGWIDKSGKIAISDQKQATAAARTMAHELAHHFCGHMGSDLDTAHKELEAESVAYVVMSRLGFECGAMSFGYVAAWAQGDTKAAQATIKASAGRINKAAKQIIGETA